MVNKNQNPLRIYCKKCGAPAGYDIVRQTYCCKYCRQTAGLEEVKEDLLKWQKLQAEDTKKRIEAEITEECSCPTCGAKIIFKDADASEKCDFCGSRLVRRKITEETQMPELIIPFTITQEEARKRILNWGKEHKKTVEGRSVISSMGNLKGYYLPFRIVKGPVTGEVTRQQTDRKFHIQGYIEENVVNISKQLDNMVLNEIEPFNWNEAKPFEFAYISGQNVKLSELSDKDIQERIFEEVKEEFLPDVEKAMQTTGLDMELESNELLSLSVLLPVYFIKSGKLTLVMNGQTGRIAVYKERKKKRTKLYLLEPLFYTLVISTIITYVFKYDIGMFCLNAFIFGCIFCGIFSQDRTSLFKRIILKTKRTKAERVNKNLEIVEVKEDDNIFKNTFDNTPVFFEENEEGKSVPVKIRFYSLKRWITILLNILALIFMPALIAGVIRLITIIGTKEPFFEHFNLLYGAVWFVIAFIFSIIYYSKGIRTFIYNYPIIYEILPNGKEKKVAEDKASKVGIYSMLTAGETDSKEKGSIFSLIRDFGGLGYFLAGFILVSLLVSVIAILD